MWMFSEGCDFIRAKHLTFFHFLFLFNILYLFQPAVFLQVYVGFEGL